MNKDNLHILIQASLDGNATSEQIRDLSARLEADEAARSYYIDYVNLYSRFKLKGISDLIDDDVICPSCIDENVLEQLLLEEKSAPAVEREIICKHRYEKIEMPRREFSKKKVHLFVAAVAAMICITLLPYLTSFFLAAPRPEKIGVVADCIGVKCAGENTVLAKAAPLNVSQSDVIMLEGMAQLAFDNGAIVTIEAPAKYRILSIDTIKFDYGRLYATVPQRAIGFCVKTGNTSVVDLGTEFGVYSSLAGDTEVHTMKGKVAMAGLDDTSRVSMEITEGKAVLVSLSEQKISNIPVDNEMFVRRIDSDSNTIWRGQSSISLADVVGGGSGFGTGKLGAGVNPETGIMADRYVVHFGDKPATGEYMYVANEFIDGVFVPIGGRMKVSSAGHIYSGLDSTSTRYFCSIGNGPNISERPRLLKQFVDSYGPNYRCFDLHLNGRKYGVQGSPAIYMHSNSAITFDIEKMRRAVNGAEIDRFEAIIGVPEDLKNAQPVLLDWYILIDGELKLSKEAASAAQNGEVVSLPLNKGRFLTLMVTDTDEKLLYDWCVVAQPRITLKMN
ncbi:MAG: NPCBM/NEW2 domain-containing protein [Phycisphaerae bacterium]|jgi:hypothetical protein